MDLETADILGQPTLPILEQIPEAGSSISVWKWILGLGALCVLYSIVMRIRLQILMWKEKSTKLATRRKYGIPDHDRRPFNVAYTAAILANEEREKEEGKRAFLRQPPTKPVQEAQSLNHRESHADQSFNPATSEQTIQLRVPELSLIFNGLTSFADDSDRYGTSTSLVLPGAYSSTPNPTLSSTKPSTSLFTGYPSNKSGYPNSSRSRKHSGQLYLDQNGNSRHAARNIVDLSSGGDPRKRGYEEQGLDEAELSKKTRIDRDELVDGDEEAQWDDFETALSHQRGAKRVFGDEDSGAEGSRDKRARKVSLDKSGRAGYVDEGMDVDDEMYDEVPDLLSPVRGKKRDRAEAGSTFGGDDSDSGQENEKLRQRRRKRRTVAKRKSDTGLLNGHKRDRDMDVDEEMGYPGTPNRRHHKKGKRHSNAHRDGHNSENSDVSIDDSLASSTRSRHRRIGEEWESNGIRYKIARNGQRLRQALVKRARNKFVMPQDSLHPDKDENLEVYVECWLTEEEYQEAKEKMRLAWQDSPKASAEPENLSVKIPLPKATPTRSVGKDLLWSSTVSTPNHSPATGSPLDSPIDFPLLRPKGLRNPARYSLGSQTSLRNNPFEKQSSITTKRIASASYLNQAIHGGLSDSTNTRPRNLSKWERQEIEAEAITKLRAIKRAEDDAKEREEKEKADKAEKERLERERVLKERLEKERLEKERLEKEERARKEKEAAAAAAAPAIPSILVTQPSESSTPAAAPAPTGFSFTPTAPGATAASVPAAPKPTGQALTTAFFAPPSAPKPATTPTATSPSPLFGPAKTDAAPAQPAASPQNLFSFKTPGAPASATTPTATTSPFSFGVTPATSNPAAKAPTTSVFGQPPATTSQPSATEEKKSGFSFGATATTGSVFGSNPSQPTAPTPAPASTSASTGNKFNFFGAPNAGGDAKTAATQQPAAPAGGAFSFGAPAATTTPAAEPAKNGAASTTAGTTSKFSFGGPAPTTTATPAFGSTTSAPSPFGIAPSTSTNGVTTSAFGQTPSSLSSAFGPAKTATTGATSSIFGAPSTVSNGAAATSSTATGKPAFSFGAAATTGGDKGKTPETPTSNKTPAMFGFGGSAPAAKGSTSVFGAGAGAGTSTSVFGKPADSSSSSTPTAGAANKFSFGTPVAASSSSTTPATTTTETPKTFSYAPGTAAATTTPAGAPTTGFSFSFGANKAPAPAAGAGSGSVFGGAAGQPSTPAAFGFGAPAAGTTTTPAGTPAAFTFGKQ